MSNIINNIIEDNYLGFSSTIICAIRYCLGRRTYMPSLVTGFVSGILSDLETKDLNIIRKDVIEHGKTSWSTDSNETVDDRGLYMSTYGDDCDYIDWMRFLDRVEEELVKRSLIREES